MRDADAGARSDDSSDHCAKVEASECLTCQSSAPWQSMLTEEDLESEAERLIWKGIESGQLVDRRVGDPERDDPAHGGSWGHERTVRAELLIELLTTQRQPSRQPPRALRLYGARITGNLDLAAATLLCPLVLEECHLEAPLTLDAAGAPSIRLAGSSVQSISGRQLETRGNLTLDRVTAKKLDLEGVHVGGRLSMNGATLHEGGLVGYGGVQVDGDILCREVTAEGRMSLAGAEIGGKLDFGGAELHQDLDLSGVDVGGSLSFDRATLHGCLIAQGLRVGRSMFCRVVDGQRFRATGELRLAGAHIGGVLSFNGARLSNENGPALSADGLRVDRDVSCQNITAKGEVRISGAHVGGQLLFDGARLCKNLIAYGLRVDGSMFCRERFTAGGDVGLTGAHVGARLSFAGATLEQALIAERLQVDWNMLCQNITVKGDVCLLDAHVGGQLSFDGATLTSVLNLEGACVEGDVRLLFSQPPPRTIDLSGSRLGRLFDSEKTWPAALKLRGCVYASVEAREDAREHADCEKGRRPDGKDVPTKVPSAGGQGKTLSLARGWSRVQRRGSPDVERRLRWIKLAEDSQLDETTAAGYAPQPYTQLMAVYRQEGRDSDARRVGYQRERHRRGQLDFLSKSWNFFLQWTVRYGYTPLLALGWLAVLVVAGTLVFSSFHNHGQLVIGPFHSHGRLVAVKSHHSPFVASIYTLDRLIPVVSFGLRDAFAPTGAAQWWAFAYTLLGWVLTIAVVAGLTAAVRRD